MCKGGGSSVTGDNNKLSTIDEHLNKGNIMDKEQGITFISVHLNTLVGSVTGTLICIGLATLLIYICSGPMRKCWKRMRGSTRSSERRSTRSSETTTRTGGGGSASTGTEMQCLDRRFSEVPYPMYPYVTPMNPYGFGPYGPQNTSGVEGAAHAPPSGSVTATKAMTPVT